MALPKDIEEQLAAYDRAEWIGGARRMWAEWKEESPNVCVLAWLRFAMACDDAVTELRAGKKAYTISLPYLSNGLPIKNYKRRVTLEDFGLAR